MYHCTMIRLFFLNKLVYHLFIYLLSSLVIIIEDRVQNNSFGVNMKIYCKYIVRISKIHKIEMPI